MLQAQEINLNPIPREQRDVIAKKLQDGELCKVNLEDTRKTLEKCASDGASDHSLTVAVGFMAFLFGALLGRELSR